MRTRGRKPIFGVSRPARRLQAPPPARKECALALNIPFRGMSDLVIQKTRKYRQLPTYQPAPQ